MLIKVNSDLLIQMMMIRFGVLEVNIYTSTFNDVCKILA